MRRSYRVRSPQRDMRMTNRRQDATRRRREWFARMRAALPRLDWGW